MTETEHIPAEVPGDTGAAQAPAPAAEAEADTAVAEPHLPAPAKVPELTPAACAARLSELFPALFLAGSPPKPIKLRIQVDIQARAPGVFTKRVLSLFLSRHTTTTAYIKALLGSPHRFDLDGQPAGEIEELHRAAATEELARRRALQEARRATERDAHHAAQRHAQAAQRDEQRAAQREHAAADAARRERYTLLRSFETSTLTKANFCALKGLAEPALDAVLAQARQEREQRPAMPPPHMQEHTQEHTHKRAQARTQERTPERVDAAATRRQPTQRRPPR